jgi:hypothetical protein
MKMNKVARGIGLALIVLGVASVLFGFTGYLSTGHSAQRGDCDSDLPQVEAEKISPDQWPIVDLEPFPFALTCTWIREDGSTYIQRYERWGTTVFLYGGALVGVTGILLVTLPRVRKSSS